MSQEPIRRTLPRLAEIPLGLAEVVMRDAAGRTAVEKRERVVEYLRGANPAQVLALDVRDEPVMIIDLSIDSPLLSGDPRDNDEPSLTKRLFAKMAEDGVKVAVGGYDEPRLLYVAAAFSLGPRPTDEHRTIHIGLDLFAEAGTVVCAPLDGTVHAFADNAFPQDYGPVIILRHETDRGDEFFTLYGHLSRESLRRVARRRPRSRRRAHRDARCAGRERRMDAASSSPNHARPARPRNRFPRRGAAIETARVDRALSRSEPARSRAELSDFPGRRHGVVANARCASCSDRRQPQRRVQAPVEDRARVDAVPVRRRRSPLHRRVQQRAARRPLSSARRRGRRRADARSQHEYALSERHARPSTPSGCSATLPRELEVC